MWGVMVLFEDIDFKNCKILYYEKNKRNCLSEDLLQIECPNGRIIDVGWYGTKNGFRVVVIENLDWEKPCYEIVMPKFEFAEKYLQDFIIYETTELSSDITILFQQFKDIVEAKDIDRESISESFSNAYHVLINLQSMGLGADEVFAYLSTYALQFRNRDELRWDFICDLLDYVMGFCLPDLRIWDFTPL